MTERVARNVAVVELIDDLESTGRTITDVDRAVLSGWTGWGAASKLFEPDDTTLDSARERLSRFFDDDDWAAAKRSTLNAHFTDPAITTAMWSMMQATGFHGGRVLEPGCGTGLFIGTAPMPVRDASSFVGVELEPVTAKVAQLLYPEADVRSIGFEKVRDVDGSFDAAIGNVPFGNYPLFDPLHNPDGLSIHNHFLAKSLALTKPGGVMAMVTSRYTLDSRNPASRRLLQSYGDLVAAVRLPSGAHQQIAGTQAVTDVLVFKRRHDADVPAPFDWETTTLLDTDTAAVRANSIFDRKGRGVVVGSITAGRGMYGDDELIVTKPDDWQQRLASVVDTLGPQLVDLYDPSPATPVRPEPPQVGGRELRLKELYLSDTGALVESTLDGPVAVKTKNKRVGRQMVALVNLRDTARTVMDLQSHGQTPGAVLAWDEARLELNRLYDDYARTHGPLNALTDGTGRRVLKTPARFRTDAGWPLVSALEVFDQVTGVATKADLFDKWLVRPERTHLGAETLPEALAASMARDRVVDVDFIASLVAGDVDAVRAELLNEQLVFADPETSALVSAEMYLSGNVRSKLAAARAAAEINTSLRSNVDALIKVVPPWLPADVITARLGSVWIDADDVKAFLVDTPGADPDRLVVEHAALVGKWAVAPSWSDERSVAATTEWGTDRSNAFELVSDALNMQPTVLWYTDDDNRRRKDVAATLEANDKRRDLEERFSEWVWEDPDRAARLETKFNERFNSTVLTQWDGSRMGELAGLSPAFTPHRHQLDAVWRVMGTDTSTILPHKVGSGKTAAMVMSARQLKRTGQISKPLFVVKNHMLEQFSSEFQHLYPTAKILVASIDDVSAEKRQTFVARCASGDWDGVVMTQSTFKKIPASAETQADFIRDELTIYDEAASAASAAGQKKAAKEIEKSKARLNTELSKLLNIEVDADNITFESLGVDYLVVDESHAYKGLKFPTSMQGVAGSTSQQATDMVVKLDWLRSQYGPKVALFASGTPITNTLAEMWVLKRMLVPDLLAEHEMQSFDSWAGTFAQSVTKMELSPEGGRFRMNTRLASFDNIPELLTLFHSFADFLDEDALAGIKVPDLVAGGAEIVLVPGTPQLDQLISELGERADAIRSGPKTKDAASKDNMLVVCNDGRLGSLDLRLIGREQPPGTGKVDFVADKVATLWERYRDNVYFDSTGGTSDAPGALQVVFADKGTPNTERGWDVYNELRDLLAERGLDPTRVRFIHDAKDDKAKERLFAACRNGDVDVVVGSTDKIGVGTNFQDRLIALHHVDCPWRPSDIEQREGRAIRQGNQNDHIHTIRYVTSGSFDPFMYQTLERKQRFISQVTASATIDPTVRSIDDLDSEIVLSYAELKAISTGNPLIQEHAEVVAEHARMARLAANHDKTQRQLPGRIASVERQLTSAGHRIDGLARVEDNRVNTRGERFEYTSPSGRRFTDRPDAGDSLRETLRGLRGSEEWASVGTIGGLEMQGRSRDYGEHTGLEFGVPGVINNIAGSAVSYTTRDLFDASPHGIMIRAERHLERVAPELQDLRAHVESLTEQATRARGLVGQKFGQVAEIERLATHIEDLEVEMAALEHDGPAGTGGPDIGDGPGPSPLGDPAGPGPNTPQPGAAGAAGTVDDRDKQFDVPSTPSAVGGGGIEF